MASSKNYRIGMYEKAVPADLSWTEKLEFAGSCGYDFVEISIDETDAKLARLDWGEGERRKLLQTMRETGVPVRSMCLSGHRKYPLGSMNPAVRERSLEIMKKALVLADDLGIRIIQLAGYDVYYEEGSEDTRAFFAEGLKKAVSMAESFGIILGFETMETPFLDTVAKGMYWVDEINSPYLGMYPDAGNLTNAAKLYGHEVTDDMETGRGHTFALHLKETVPGSYREVPFFTGHVDFDNVARKAFELGVRRFVTEMWYTGNDWRKDVADACSSMKGILDKACADKACAAESD